MKAWYVRDRGRVLGPFTAEQVLDLKEQGQIQGYHEASTDQRTWKALDLIPALGGPTPPPSGPVSRPRRQPPVPASAPATGGSSKYTLVVAGVVALVMLGGLAVGGVLLYRSGSTNTTATGTGTGGGTRVPEGAIRFSPRTSLPDRDQALADSVGLVVAGAIVKFPDGAKTESPEFGTGSGFAITPDGYLITNRHVVEDLVNFNDSEIRRTLEAKAHLSFDPRIWVFFGRKNQLEATVSYLSPDYDLAILKLNKPAPRYFALCHVEDTRIPLLDAVSSIGFPGSDRKANQALNPNNKIEIVKGASIQRAFQDADFNMTKENGAIKRPVQKARPDAKFLEAYYLVHTARIAGGNSGGPLITPDGTVIGINTLGIQIALGGIKINQEGQNFALTMSQLRKEIDRNVPGVTWRELPE